MNLQSGPESKPGATIVRFDDIFVEQLAVQKVKQQHKICEEFHLIVTTEKAEKHHLLWCAASLVYSPQVKAESLLLNVSTCHLTTLINVLIAC